ncbi:MAG: transposase [Methanogenium sp.]|nr:transposase [Methanogenium sp.]
MATRRLNRATQGTGYLGQFAGFLTYKAKRAGKKVIEISERKTSKTCCVCGQAISNLPIICEKRVWIFQYTRRKLPA